MSRMGKEEVKKPLMRTRAEVPSRRRLVHLTMPDSRMPMCCMVRMRPGLLTVS
jgi:hypothetical protein